MIAHASSHRSFGYLRSCATAVLVALALAVMPTAAREPSTTGPPPGAVPESLSGSFVVFDPSLGGDACFTPGVAGSFCFRAETFTTDYEYIDSLWERLPIDWTVTGVDTGGLTPYCTGGGDFGAFAWSFQTPSYELRIDHPRYQAGSDHCVAAYCIDAIAGTGTADALVSWYWDGDGYGGTPHHPCSSDGYTPAGQGACDEMTRPPAAVPPCASLELTPDVVEVDGCCDEPQVHEFTASNNAGYAMNMAISYTIVGGAGACSGPATVPVASGGSTPFSVEITPTGDVGDTTVCEIGAVDPSNPANHDESQLIVHLTHFVWDPAGWQGETVTGAYPTMWASCAAGWDPAAGRQVGYYVGGLDAAGEVQPLLQVFDPALGAWTQLPPPPDPMFSQVVSVIGGKLYVSGGFHSAFDGSTNLQVFDPATDTWDDTGYPDIPTPSGGLGGGAGGAGTCHTGSGLCHFHVGGGVSPEFHLETWEFSPATNAWTPLDDRPPCPSLQGFAFGGGVGCRGYVFVGGNLMTNHDFHRLDATAPAGAQWVQLEDIPGDCGAYSPAMVCNEAEGAVYVIGGDMSAGNMSGVVGRYDIAADSWTVLPLYHEGLLGPCGVKMAGRIWTFGGARDVYALDPPPHESLAQVFCPEGLPFADGFESGDTTAWWVTVP